MASAKPQRVLLYRLGSLGDHLIALPCYRLVARVFPGAERLLLTNVPVSNKAAAAEAVLGGSGLVDGFMTYVVGERSPVALARLWWKIFRWRPDVLVYLGGARGVKLVRRDATFFRLCGVKRLVGVPLAADLQGRRELGTRVVQGIETPWYEEEGVRLTRCLSDLGDAGAEDQANWAPGLTENERAQAAQLLAAFGGGPFFGFSLGSKAQSNHWGVERWISLWSKVAAEWPGHGLVLDGAPDERAASETVAEAWRAVAGSGPVLNLCGATSLRVSAAVLERAVLFVGHDSGPGHLAASVGTPVLGVFSARMLSGEWTPHGRHVRIVLHWVECGGCVLDTCIAQGKKCILSITVEEALTAVREYLREIENAKQEKESSHLTARSQELEARS